MDGLLKVTPEKLLSTSEEFGSLGNQMNSLTQEMMSLVQNLRSIWLGDAQDAYGNKFSSLQTDMDKLYRMIQEHSEDLATMARAYQEAENANAEKGNSMRANIIV